MLDFTFAILTVLSIRPERAGTLVYISIVPPPPPLQFSILPSFYVDWGKWLGVNDKSLCIEEPLPIFFQCVEVFFYFFVSLLTLSFLSKLCKGVPQLNLFRVDWRSHYLSTYLVVPLPFK